MSHTLPISNKAKEMHYKIVHGYVATNHLGLLYKMNIINSDVCNFCKHCEQTVHCTKTYIPTTWESIGYADISVLNPAN